MVNDMTSYELFLLKKWAIRIKNSNPKNGRREKYIYLCLFVSTFFFFTKPGGKNMYWY